MSERLDLVPLPVGVSGQRADFAADPILAFSQKHYDLGSLDPFRAERGQSVLPQMEALRFTTAGPPREVYLFYKRFLNEQGRITNDKERTLPYYNSRSYTSFDEKNEADIPQKTTPAGAVFYRIDARGSQGKRLNIIVFNEGNGQETVVYLITSDEVKIPRSQPSPPPAATPGKP